MPVIATPISKSTSLVDRMRLFLRDSFDKNHLLADLEFSDEEISVALEQATQHANVLGRPTSYTVDTFPNEYVLKLGVASYLHKTEAIRQLRNQATYQDGNIQGVGVDDKSSGYLQLSNMFQQEFVQHVQNIKITGNLQTSGFRSPLGRGRHRV